MALLFQIGINMRKGVKNEKLYVWFYSFPFWFCVLLLHRPFRNCCNRCCYVANVVWCCTWNVNVIGFRRTWILAKFKGGQKKMKIERLIFIIAMVIIFLGLQGILPIPFPFSLWFIITGNILMIWYSSFTKNIELLIITLLMMTAQATQVML